jgi:N-hydroxyarylamine O-acetyltransferase
VERVLERLGFSARPAADRGGLAALYAAWCRSVPFDNARKLIALRAGSPAPLPGDAAEDFLEAWLAHGVGGTCWAMHTALTAVFAACGFDARRAIATMLVAPDLPPNHGSATVRLGGETLLVDGCIQHGEPLPLEAARDTAIAHPAWGVRARPVDGTWLVRWRSPFAPEGFDCRIDSLAGDASAFRSYHEHTRTWSPFNYQLFVRRHRDGGVIGLARGERVDFAADGTLTRAAMDRAARLRFLVEELGVSEELAQRVPDDVPMPPPPGSATARGAR